MVVVPPAPARRFAKIALCCAAASALIAAMPVNAEGIALAEKGHALAEILAPGTGEVEKFAAAELAKYLSRMGSCEFKVSGGAKLETPSIAVGTIESLKPLLEKAKIDTSALAKADQDSFIIDVQANKAFIVGATPRAALYGVYDLLEDDLGARWSIPGPQGEFIPVRDTLKLADGRRMESPTFPIRCFELMTRDPNPQPTIDIIDWIAKRKMNLCQIAWCYVDWQQYEKSLRQEIARRGLESGITNHSYSNLIPVEKYSASHPEFYALRSGVRKWDKGYLSNFTNHLCTSNPELVSTMAMEMDAFSAKFPELTQIGMLPPDGWNFCQCPACAKMVTGDCGDFWAGQKVPNGTNLILDFVNNVNKAFKPGHPKATLWFESYSPTILPPTSMAPDPDVNVVVFIYWRCALHPLSDTACQRSREYADVLRGWRKAAKGKMIISDYFCGLSQPIPWWPPMSIMKADYEFFNSLGIDGVKMWGLNSVWYKIADLASYLNAELLWDVRQDEQKALRMFCEGRYRAAADAMMRYYAETALEMKQAAKANPVDSVPNTWPMPAVWMKNPEKLRALLEQARKDAGDDITAQAGVRDAWTQNEYNLLLAEVGKADILCKKAISSTGNDEERKAAFTAFEKAVGDFSVFFKAHLKDGLYYGTTKKFDEMVKTYWKSGKTAQQALPGPVLP